MENQFELLHVGLNSGSPEKAEETAKLFSLMFNLPVKMGNSSVFAGTYFECMKSPSARGTNGHIAIGTNSVERAIYHLGLRGVTFDETTRKTDGVGKTKAIYLDGEVGDFALQLTQK